MKPTIFHNGTIVDAGTRFEGSLVVEGDQIKSIDTLRTAAADISIENYNVIDCRGCFILPGAIDEHVHFRDPGMTEKGDIATESRAAIAGGVTSFFDMPNTVPQTTSIEAWEAKMQRAASCSAANYAFFLGATNSNLDTLLSADYSRIPGAKLFMGSSTGGMLLDDNDQLTQLFSRFPHIIACHAESEPIIAANRARLQEQMPNGIPVKYHSAIRSREACLEATRRAVELARRTGARLHVMHLTTADELQFFSPGDLADKRITAETCPHYLCFTDDSVEATGGLTKCNPAIKTAADRSALRAAVADGRIDVIATDHAPHLLAQKLNGTALTAASGMPSVQFSLLVMLQLAREGVLTVETVVERMCAAPAQLFHVERRGALRRGYYADLVVVEPTPDYQISHADVVSRCGWTPYNGFTLSHRVAQTWVNGVAAYVDGQFTAANAARALTFAQ